MPAAGKAELISFIDAGGGIRGTKPIAVLPDEYMGNIGAKTCTVQLSSDTLQKNAARHPEITTQDYMNLQSIIDRAQLVVQDGENTLVFIETGVRIYHAAIKATQTGEGLFMTIIKANEQKSNQRYAESGKGHKRIGFGWGLPVPPHNDPPLRASYGRKIHRVAEAYI